MSCTYCGAVHVQVSVGAEVEQAPSLVVRKDNVMVKIAGFDY